MLDRLAHGDKQFQPLAGREIALVAVLGNRDALDQLHDEVGAARRRYRRLACMGVDRRAACHYAGVVDFGDIGMVHHR